MLYKRNRTRNCDFTDKILIYLGQILCLYMMQKGVGVVVR